MTSRRDVMAALGAIGGAMPFATAARAQAKTTAPALIVSTWDFGAAANEAAFARMKAGGSLLDVVEAGALPDHAAVEAYAADLCRIHAEPEGHRDLIARHRLGPDLVEPARRRAEIGNFLDRLVRPRVEAAA